MKTKSFEGSFTPEYENYLVMKRSVATDANDWIEVKFSTLSTNDLELLKIALEKELENRE